MLLRSKLHVEELAEVVGTYPEVSLSTGDIRFQLTDEKDIDSRDLCDLLDVVDGLTRLDLDNDQEGVVRCTRVLRLGDAERVPAEHGTVATSAERRVLAVPYNTTSVVGRVTHGRHDSVGTGVKSALDHPLGVDRHTDDRARPLSSDVVDELASQRASMEVCAMLTVK